MSEGFDVSTRKLKRMYLRAIRRVWKHQKSHDWEYLRQTAARDHTELKVWRDSCREELKRRGWDM